MPFIRYNGKQVLFVHIPKAGGTSVEHWMESIAPLRLFSIGVPNVSRCTPQHYRAQDILGMLGRDFFDLSVAIVRNPYDRIASEYRMQVQIAESGFWKKAPRFSEWLDENLEKFSRNRFHLDNHLRPQWEFVSTNVEIFRLEDGIQAPIARISEVLGVACPELIPHELKGAETEVEWDVPDRLRVQDVYYKDFELFGYQK